MRQLHHVAIFLAFVSLAAGRVAGQTQPASTRTGVGEPGGKPAASLAAMQHNFADSLLANPGLAEADKERIRGFLKDFDAGMEKFPPGSLMSYAQADKLMEPLGQYLAGRPDLNYLAMMAGRNIQCEQLMIIQDLLRLAPADPNDRQADLRALFLGPPEYVPLLQAATGEEARAAAAKAILEKSAVAAKPQNDDALEQQANSVRKQIRATLTPEQNAALDWALTREPSDKHAGLKRLDMYAIAFSTFVQPVKAPEAGKYVLRLLGDDSDKALATVALKKGEALGFRPGQKAGEPTKAYAGEKETAVNLTPGDVAVWSFETEK